MWDAAGNVTAQAPVVIVANGTNATSFVQTKELPLSAIRGQVTHVSASELPDLPVVLCGDGYVTRPAQGICCVGASYDTGADPLLRRDSQDENLARLAQVLLQAALIETASNHPLVGRPLTGRALSGRPLTGRALSGRVGFRCVAPDRLPLVGALPDYTRAITGSRLRDVPRLPGLYGLLAYGSRGLVWAPFAAEMPASILEGEPLPVETELAMALDPARFALKAHRRRASVPSAPTYAEDYAEARQISPDCDRRADRPAAGRGRDHCGDL